VTKSSRREHGKVIVQETIVEKIKDRKQSAGSGYTHPPMGGTSANANVVLEYYIGDVGSPGEIRIRGYAGLPSAGFSSGGGDPEPSSGCYLAPMLCVVPRVWIDHYTTGLPA
jgi:hypothetical protein